MTDPRGPSPRPIATDAACVDRFAKHMLSKLRVNARKAHWSTVSQAWLLGRLRQEVAELEAALASGRGVESECADVANFAMMIADNFEEGIRA